MCTRKKAHHSVGNACICGHRVHEFGQRLRKWFTDVKIIPWLYNCSFGLQKWVKGKYIFFDKRKIHTFRLQKREQKSTCVLITKEGSKNTCILMYSILFVFCLKPRMLCISLSTSLSRPLFPSAPPLVADFPRLMLRLGLRDSERRVVASAIHQIPVYRHLS